MKKIFIAIMLVVVLFVATGCFIRVAGNRVVGGPDVQTFHYAWVYLGNNEIAEGPVTQWRDYDNSDVVQVMIKGKYYCTHYTNVVMVADPELGSIGYDLSGDLN